MVEWPPCQAATSNQHGNFTRITALNIPYNCVFEPHDEPLTKTEGNDSKSKPSALVGGGGPQDGFKSKSKTSVTVSGSSKDSSKSNTKSSATVSRRSKDASKSNTKTSATVSRSSKDSSKSNTKTSATVSRSSKDASKSNTNTAAVPASRPAGCSPRNQLAFIKTHKTGSSTLRQIVNIYGFYRNLSFMLNKQNSRTGHIRYLHITQKGLLPPIGVDKGNYDRYRHSYDMCSVHYRYNRTLFNFVMKKSTKYITILRNPVTQFESAFVYFGQARKTRGGTIEAKINNWMEKPNRKSRFNRLNNHQIFDLGMPTKYFHNAMHVGKYIERLSGEFDLVLLMEYFDESLLLLRKLMCWSFEDILYLQQNVQQTKKKKMELGNAVKRKIRKHNSADLRLYEYFNKSLWRKVKAYGPTFRTDLAYLRQRLKDVHDECVGGRVTTKRQKHNVHERLDYTVTDADNDYCVYLTRDTHTKKKKIVRQIWERQSKPLKKIPVKD